MMAQKYPNAKILAIDNNSNATQLAQTNFEQNEIGRNCRAATLDFMNSDETSTYELIVSNPPYFLDSFIPKQTVLGEAKHLKSSDLILFFQKSAQLLSANGKLNMIFPVDERFETTAEEVGLFPERILHVYGKPDLLKRKCIQFGFERKEPQIESLTIRTSSGAYTETYKKLTVDFHGVSLWLCRASLILLSGAWQGFMYLKEIVINSLVTPVWYWCSGWTLHDIALRVN